MISVLKFGGSSVADGQRIEKIVQIIRDAAASHRICVVLSACKGVTDDLIWTAQAAARGDETYSLRIDRIKQKHVDIVRYLFRPAEQGKIITSIQLMINELEEITHGIDLIKECTLRTLDLIMSFGERLSCTIVSSYLLTQRLSTEYVDARELIITDDRYGNAMVDFVTSYRRMSDCILPLDSIPIITGFISSTKEGVTTTLGRNGSDYTASLVGAGVDADRIEIWTDVEGVLSADPAHVENAFVIRNLSYQEAMELSYFGARVLHPYTMIPAIDKNIPIVIKNSFQPRDVGTLISQQVSDRSHAITGIASIDNIALVNVEGGGMLGIPGIAARVFGALAKADVNIIMISQASSEHSICLVFHEGDASKALESLRNELISELESKRIENFDLREDVAIIAVIGENMRGTPGISGKLFSALGDDQINVFAIAQGSSERNISFVVHKEDKESTLRTIHRAFLENEKT